MWVYFSILGPSRATAVPLCIVYPSARLRFYRSYPRASTSSQSQEVKITQIGRQSINGNGKVNLARVFGSCKTTGLSRMETVCARTTPRSSLTCTDERPFISSYNVCNVNVGEKISRPGCSRWIQGLSWIYIQDPWLQQLYRSLKVGPSVRYASTCSDQHSSS